MATPARLPVSTTSLTGSTSFCYQGRGGGGNIHDTELGCINALLIAGSTTEAAIEEVLAAIRACVAANPFCAKWDWDKERRYLEEKAYSFINKFPDYADRLPPELYAMRQRRRGQGVADPILEYDRRRKRWHYPEDNSETASADETGDAKTEGAKVERKPRIQLVPLDHLRPGTDASYLIDELIPLRGIVGET
jgi:hypothetical protein